MMNNGRVVLLAVGLLGAGCTKTVNQCSVDSDCDNVAYPFCDVNGEYPSSGGVHNVCTIVPPGCSIERCGCDPGATTCAASTLSTCSSDGKSTSEDQCSLGCAATSDRCLSFKPLNGLNAAMLAAAAEPAITFPASVTINTDTGVVKDGAGVTVFVNSIVVSQPGAADIRAYIASSFDVTEAIVSGSKGLAFVAPHKILIHGIVDASANSTTAGPGGAEAGACRGGFATTGGGGGNATPGGAGAVLGFDLSTNMFTPGGAPGAATAAFEPLIGGCRGGGPGGGGGGSVQIDSLDTIELAQTGLLDLGGGGGNGYSGGGSGGTLILEAPAIVVAGTIVANGAAGADCNTTGADGTRTSEPAFGPSCGSGPSQSHGGAGGTRASAATSGGGNASSGQGGGGGSVGRVLVKSSDGNYVAGA